MPVAKLAASRPVTRPRRRTNHRVATIADSGIEIAPVAVPITMPHRMSSCHNEVIAIVNAASPATAMSPATMTRRAPMRSTNAAANGAARP